MILKLELLAKQRNMLLAQKADVVIATFLWSFSTNEDDFLAVNGVSQPKWRPPRSFICSSLMSCSLVLQVWQWLSWLLPGYGLRKSDLRPALVLLDQCTLGCMMESDSISQHKAGLFTSGLWPLRWCPGGFQRNGESPGVRIPLGQTQIPP